MTLLLTEHEPTEQSPIERLPYEKPTARQISLVADQVLGTNCKNVFPYSTGLGGLTYGCYASSCRITQGS